MNIKEQAEVYFEKEQLMQESDDYVTTEGDEIYCRIGELLQEVGNEELAEKIDMLILEMSEADQKEYYIKGFEAGAKTHK